MIETLNHRDLQMIDGGRGSLKMVSPVKKNSLVSCYSCRERIKRTMTPPFAKLAIFPLW